MAVLHRAELKPTKLELLAAWLPGRPWFPGETGAGLALAGSFRFDDPAGAVGIETMLVRVGGGPVCQVPLTYRDAPLSGAERWLVGHTDHSVLGQRWVYDACGDPVYAAALAQAIFGRAGQAEQFIETDGRLERREPSMSVLASGTEDADVPTVDAIDDVVDSDPTLIRTATAELAIVRRLDDTTSSSDTTSRDDTTSRGGATLTATWPGHPAPALLAYLPRL